MLFNGSFVQLLKNDSGIYEVVFDNKNAGANTFNVATITDLKQAIDLLYKDSDLKGVLFRSGKESFILGADITEFTELFKKSDQELETWLWNTQELLNRIEDLSVPTLSAIHGFSLGGGFEVTLATTFRLASTTAKIGLPETKLGIIPGWGGTVRLSRIIGADNAIEWIASGKHFSPADALKIGAIDGVVAPDKMVASALEMLGDAITGKLNWKDRLKTKTSPLTLNKIESTMAFETSKAFVGAMAGPNYPAPLIAIEAIQAGSTLPRNEALKIEMQGFMKVARTPQAQALIGVFLGDQAVKKIAKKLSSQSNSIKSAGVLGAGIMGGGIAYQSASSKIPVIMKDIKEASLDLGMKEAAKILEKRVEKGQLKTAEMAHVLSTIRPTLSADELKEVDIVVEAVIENEKIKSQVLTDLEKTVKPGTIITSNTSTISINRLAKNLKNPENFCGMHFFNPVHRMPLVEIIRGEKSSEKTIATAVAYAGAMGKTAIVVNDCPGFLVNRILFPYFGGFMMLMRDGADFTKVDKVMEKYGWPMGPAYLLDVVGIDTAHHALDVMSQGFPDRMKYDFKSVIDLQYEAGRYGQKNGKGFFNYSQDQKGKPVKAVDPEIVNFLKPAVKSNLSFSDDEIIERMMLPMIFESSRCLEEKIVSSPIEVDLSVLYGLGYPPFRGGVMRYADSVGAKKLVQLGEKYSSLGKMYEPTSQIKEMSNNSKTFY
ncbi:MAG: fatty acid oxidation complex subunit alpha FadB [Xanthomonadaceae bacterium]|nr:fatty acid oxidation complex subunit alpha FadB [Xanthomonadaceae bacterium]